MKDLISEISSELACKSQHALDSAMFDALRKKGVVYNDIFDLANRGHIINSPDGTNTLIIDNEISICQWKALDPVYSKEENSIKAVMEYQFQYL